MLSKCSAPMCVRMHVSTDHLWSSYLISSHLSLNREGRWGTTDDFATSFLHFTLFPTALLDVANSRPVHSLMLSPRLLFCLPCLLPLIEPCKMVLARPEERETCPYHFSLRLFTMVRRSSCGPIACWILARTSSLVTRDFVRENVQRHTKTMLPTRKSVPRSSRQSGHTKTS